MIANIDCPELALFPSIRVQIRPFYPLLQVCNITRSSPHNTQNSPAGSIRTNTQYKDEGCSVNKRWTKKQALNSCFVRIMMLDHADYAYMI